MQRRYPCGRYSVRVFLIAVIIYLLYLLSLAVILSVSDRSSLFSLIGSYDYAIDPHLIDGSLDVPQYIPMHVSRTKRKPTVAFITYEMYPVTIHGGGAGVVINGLVLDLIKKGHDVVIIGDFDQQLLRDWMVHFYKVVPADQQKGQIHIRHVPSLLEQYKVQYKDVNNQEEEEQQYGPQSLVIKKSSSIFLLKSRMFAMATHLVNREIPLDMVECFDYVGVCYELLRAPSSEENSYLPQTTTIAVRVHGTIQLIERAENKEVSVNPPSERSIMYVMEHFTMSAADLVIVQTEFFRKRISKNYNFDHKEIVLGRAPMEAILKYVDDADREVQLLEKQQFTSQLIPSDQFSGRKVFLIYGRFQLVKGLECIVDAAKQLVSQVPEVLFLFVGPDVWSPDLNMLTSKYIESKVPESMKDNFEIRPQPINRTELVKLTRSVHVAIFASQFESLNLAVHEVARLRVPLILSSIPAFVEYFKDSPQVWFFETGNPESLHRVLYRTVRETESMQRIAAIRKGLSLTKYEDATTPYKMYEYPVSGIRRRNREVCHSLSEAILNGERYINARNPLL
ncbi:hypothetical protein MP228_004101 [Amoeboaphelidium protococcarum]|nr:hypothetical protein MP228_004101 [Amoeboaphelidium protococcarum]